MENRVILAEGNELAELLPQKSPMAMVHQLLQADKESTVTRFSINTDCALLEDGFLSEAGLVENIAQTAAAGIGYAFKKENKPAPVGFIAAIKDLSVLNLPAAGTTIQTEVQELNQVMEFSIIRGRSWHEDTLLSECEMRIFLKP